MRLEDLARGMIFYGLTRCGEGEITTARGWAAVAAVGARYRADLGPVTWRPGRFLRAHPLDFQPGRSAFYRGLRLYLTRRLEDAVAAFDELVAERPSWPWSYVLRAEAKLYLGPASSAYPDLEQARSLTREHWPLLFLARAQFSAKDSACLQTLAEAVRRAPACPMAAAWNGNALGHLGRLEEGIAELERAGRLDPLYDRAFAWRGAHLLSAGRAGQALACLDEAVRLNEWYTPARLSRAEALAALGRDALPELRALGRLCVLYQWRTNFADVHGLPKERDLARVKRLLDRLPASPWSRLWRGQIALVEGDMEGAAALLRRARPLPPEWRPWADAWLGKAAGDAGLLKRALRGPAAAWAATWLGELELAAGRRQEARRLAARAVRLQPTLSAAWLLRGDMRQVASLQPSWRWAKA